MGALPPPHFIHGYLVVHVRAQGVDGLDDGLVDDLRVRVPTLLQDVDLRHHGRHVHARGEGVEGDVLLHAFRAHLLSHLFGALTKK